MRIAIVLVAGLLFGFLAGRSWPGGNKGESDSESLYHSRILVVDERTGEPIDSALITTFSGEVPASRSMPLSLNEQSTDAIRTGVFEYEWNGYWSATWIGDPTRIGFTADGYSSAFLETDTLEPVEGVSVKPVRATITIRLKPEGHGFEK